MGDSLPAINVDQLTHSVNTAIHGNLPPLPPLPPPPTPRGCVGGGTGRGGEGGGRMVLVASSSSVSGFSSCLPALNSSVCPLPQCLYGSGRTITLGLPPSDRTQPLPRHDPTVPTTTIITLLPNSVSIPTTPSTITPTPATATTVCRTARAGNMVVASGVDPSMCQAVPVSVTLNSPVLTHPVLPLAAALPTSVSASRSMSVKQAVSVVAKGSVTHLSAPSQPQTVSVITQGSISGPSFQPQIGNIISQSSISTPSSQPQVGSSISIAGPSSQPQVGSNISQDDISTPSFQLQEESSITISQQGNISTPSSQPQVGSCISQGNISTSASPQQVGSSASISTPSSQPQAGPSISISGPSSQTQVGNSVNQGSISTPSSKPQIGSSVSIGSAAGLSLQPHAVSAAGQGSVSPPSVPPQPCRVPVSVTGAGPMLIMLSLRLPTPTDTAVGPAGRPETATPSSTPAPAPRLHHLPPLPLLLPLLPPSQDPRLPTSSTIFSTPTPSGAAPMPPVSLPIPPPPLQFPSSLSLLPPPAPQASVAMFSEVPLHPMLVPQQRSGGVCGGGSVPAFLPPPASSLTFFPRPPPPPSCLSSSSEGQVTPEVCRPVVHSSMPLTTLSTAGFAVPRVQSSCASVSGCASVSSQSMTVPVGHSSLTLTSASGSCVPSPFESPVSLTSVSTCHGGCVPVVSQHALSPWCQGVAGGDQGSSRVMSVQSVLESAGGCSQMTSGGACMQAPPVAGSCPSPGFPPPGFPPGLTSPSQTRRLLLLPPVPVPGSCATNSDNLALPPLPVLSCSVMSVSGQSVVASLPSHPPGMMRDGAVPLQVHARSQVRENGGPLSMSRVRSHPPVLLGPGYETSQASEEGVGFGGQPAPLPPFTSLSLTSLPAPPLLSAALPLSVEYTGGIYPGEDGGRGAGECVGEVHDGLCVDGSCSVEDVEMTEDAQAVDGQVRTVVSMVRDVAQLAERDTAAGSMRVSCQSDSVTVTSVHTVPSVRLEGSQLYAVSCQPSTVSVTPVPCSLPSTLCSPRLPSVLSSLLTYRADPVQVQSCQSTLPALHSSGVPFTAATLSQSLVLPPARIHRTLLHSTSHESERTASSTAFSAERLDVTESSNSPSERTTSNTTFFAERLAVTESDSPSASMCVVQPCRFNVAAVQGDVSGPPAVYCGCRAESCHGPTSSDADSSALCSGHLSDPGQCSGSRHSTQVRVFPAPCSHTADCQFSNTALLSHHHPPASTTTTLSHLCPFSSTLSDFTTHSSSSDFTTPSSSFNLSATIATAISADSHSPNLSSPASVGSICQTVLPSAQSYPVMTTTGVSVDPTSHTLLSTTHPYPAMTTTGVSVDPTPHTLLSTTHPYPVMTTTGVSVDPTPHTLLPSVGYSPPGLSNQGLSPQLFSPMGLGGLEQPPTLAAPSLDPQGVVPRESCVVSEPGDTSPGLGLTAGPTSVMDLLLLKTDSISATHEKGSVDSTPVPSHTERQSAESREIHHKMQMVAEATRAIALRPCAVSHDTTQHNNACGGGDVQMCAFTHDMTQHSNVCVGGVQMCGVTHDMTQHNSVCVDATQHHSVCVDATQCNINGVCVGDEVPTCVAGFPGGTAVDWASSHTAIPVFTGQFCLECNKVCGEEECTHGLSRHQQVKDSLLLPRSRATLPDCLYLAPSAVKGHCNTTGVFAKRALNMRTEFGPLQGQLLPLSNGTEKSSFSQWKIFYQGFARTLDLSDEHCSNWLMYVKPAPSALERNLVAFQRGHDLLMVTVKDVQPDQELCFWFAPDYGKMILGLPRPPQFCPCCSECSRVYLHRSSLRAHTREAHHHTPCKSWPCLACSDVFPSAGKLKEHKNAQHLKVKVHVCPTCGKTFNDERNLRVHRHIHTELRRFGCELCGKHFKQKAHLQSHQSTHTKVKAVQCRFCSKLFVRKSDMRQHELIHTQEKALSCPQCSRTFQKPRLLRRHLRSVHNNERNYMCERCSKTFHTKYKLTRHAHSCKNGQTSLAS